MKETLVSLEIELKKVAALGGVMAVVVVPKKHTDRTLTLMRDIDTLVVLKESIVIGMFGVGADVASAAFPSVPKGIAVYPEDGTAAGELFRIAQERLRFVGSSPIIKRFWDKVSEARRSETRDYPEIRLISDTFYQFYAFMASHANELGELFAETDLGIGDWTNGYLPYGIMSALKYDVPANREQIEYFTDTWNYKERMEQKLEKGKRTLKNFSKIDQFYTLPSISEEIIQMAREPLPGVTRSVVEIVEKDPVISSRLLKVANSAFYGSHRQIDTVEKAIHVLGNEAVMNLIFSIAIQNDSENGSAEKLKKLWHHSNMVAYLAEWLGPYFDCHVKDLLFTIGLLHDLGKIVFIQKDLSVPFADKISTLDKLAAEEKKLGISHAEMGAYIAERWHLPEIIVNGIKSHHIPSTPSHTVISVVVHVADIVAHTGKLEMKNMNLIAGRMMVESECRSLTHETVKKKYESVREKVNRLLGE